MKKFIIPKIKFIGIVLLWLCLWNILEYNLEYIAKKYNLNLQCLYTILFILLLILLPSLLEF